MAVYGRFYFKKTTNGNLIGEFSNHGMFENTTESADLVEFKESCGFVGEYLTTWRDKKSPILMNLTISHKTGSNGRIFDLEWTEENDKKATRFKGQGFLCDNILIGDYTDQINL